MENRVFHQSFVLMLDCSFCGLVMKGLRLVRHGLFRCSEVALFTVAFSNLLHLTNDVLAGCFVDMVFLFVFLFK